MATIAPASGGGRKSGSYQTLLVFLLSLNFGILFFDRNALNFLMPFVQPDLGLNNTQVGLLGSALSLTWALAALTVGGYSDRSGHRKAIIIAAGIAFSLCSVVSGLASSFLMLAAARLLMGVSEGGVMPVSHAIIAAEVAPARRGLAMGVGQNLGSSLLGSTVAPLVLVPVALYFGWRNAFFLAAVPGLISTFLIWRLVQDPERQVHHVEAARMTLGDILRERNLVLCALIAILLVAYLVICWAFMPLFLTSRRHFAPETMSWLMAVLGVSAALGSFAVPAISDYIGRKPVMIAVPLIGVILPLGALYWSGPVWLMAAIFFLGWSLNGVFPMFMATIPSETVDARRMTTAMGFVMGTGEILGGVIGPLVAGWIADATSLDAPLWLMLGLSVVAGLLALGLRETAPRVLARRAV